MSDGILKLVGWYMVEILAKTVEVLLYHTDLKIIQDYEVRGQECSERVGQKMQREH